MQNYNCDSTDRQIMDILKENARLSYSDIGKQVGLSRVAVKNRMDALENAGIIKGYQAIIDEKGNNASAVEFVLDINVKSDSYANVADCLAKEPYIRKLCVMSGRCRLSAYGFAPNMNELSRFVDSLYQRIKGIDALNFQVVMSTLKDVDGGVEYERRILQENKGSFTQQ